MITAAWTTYSLFALVFQVVLYFWPVSLLLAINAIVSILFSSFNLRLIALGVPFVWPVLILLVAAAWWNSGPRVGASDVPGLGVAVLFGIQIILSMGITYELKGRRWAATAVCMVAIWLGAISWFIAGMALTNVWL